MDGNDPTSAAARDGSLPWPLLAAVAVVVLALATSCGGASGSGAGQQPAGGGERGASTQEDQAVGRESLGDANAPVVLIEYGDYK